MATVAAAQIGNIATTPLLGEVEQPNENRTEIEAEEREDDNSVRAHGASASLPISRIY